MPADAEVERFWQLRRRLYLPLTDRRYNIAPTTIVPMIVQADDGAFELRSARWGLVPHWWKKPVLPTLSFNARSEEAANKPLWRDAWRKRRCLMPMQGWYEWNEHEMATNRAGKPCHQPYYFYAPNEPVLWVAGLWAEWQPPAGETVISCALLSREAPEPIAHIHHRMPVVLERKDGEAWLAAGNAGEQLHRLIAHARNAFSAHAVSTRVNGTHDDDAALIEMLPSWKSRRAIARAR